MGTHCLGHKLFNIHCRETTLLRLLDMDMATAMERLSWSWGGRSWQLNLASDLEASKWNLSLPLHITALLCSRLTSCFSWGYHTFMLTQVSVNAVLLSPGTAQPCKSPQLLWAWSRSELALHLLMPGTQAEGGWKSGCTAQSLPATQPSLNACRAVVKDGK